MKKIIEKMNAKMAKILSLQGFAGGGHSSNRLLEPFSPCEEKTCHYEDERSEDEVIQKSLYCNGLLHPQGVRNDMEEKTCHYERQRSNLKTDSGFPCRAAKLFAIAKKAAFTLSETLIVLSILGVIAAITVSSLVNSYQKTMNIVKLKKVYAEMTNNINEAMVVNRCTNLACIINVSGSTVSDNNQTRSFKNLSVLFPSIKKDSASESQWKCTYNKAKPFNGNTEYRFYQDITGRGFDSFCYKDNIGILVWNGSFRNDGYAGNWCNTKSQTCVEMIVLLDGKKKKAVLGRNTFGLYIKGDGSINAWQPESCSKTYNKAAWRGFGCFDYLIKNGWKMDY